MLPTITILEVINTIGLSLRLRPTLTIMIVTKEVDSTYHDRPKTDTETGNP